MRRMHLLCVGATSSWHTACLITASMVTQDMTLNAQASHAEVQAERAATEVEVMAAAADRSAAQLSASAGHAAMAATIDELETQEAAAGGQREAMHGLGLRLERQARGAEEQRAVLEAQLRAANEAERVGASQARYATKNRMWEPNS